MSLPFTRSEVARRIDHTILKADATPSDVDRICDEALAHGCASVCVNGIYVSRVAKRLAGSNVLTCAVVGFPLGACSAAVKGDEAARLIDAGARELDMVIALGPLKAGDDRAVRDDVWAVVKAAGELTVKVILETCLLDEAEKVRAARLAVDAGATFVKTSTGFGSGGATVEDVRLLKSTVGSSAKVKASGGIRDAATALAMLEAGADRLGLSATAKILAGCPE
jgi:deoxyribose-phosphate aldolase